MVEGKARQAFSSMRTCGPHGDGGIAPVLHGLSRQRAALGSLWLAVGTVEIRTSAVPRWVSYLGYLVGLTLLVAAGAYQRTQLVFPAWVLLLSLVILFDRPLSHNSNPPRGS